MRWDKRTCEDAQIEFRASEGGGAGGLLVGYGLKYNTLSSVLHDPHIGPFREQIAPGAFDGSINGGDIRSCYNHDSSLLLGRTTSGTLRVYSDAVGVRYEVQLNVAEDVDAKRVAAKVGRGDVTGSSFQFRVLADGDEWREDDTGGLVRTVKSGLLIELGPVTFPAYTVAEAALRSLDAYRADVNAVEVRVMTPQEIELELIELGG